MQRPLSLLAKATGVAAVCLLAYRSCQLYFKNDITIYITEVVHLPETAGQRRRPQSDPSLSLTIEGKVEMETCLMNSYRFLLKLVGHVRTAFPDSTKSTNSPHCTRGARHRVLSLQASGAYNNFRDDDSFSNVSATTGSRKHSPFLTITSVDPIVDAYEAESSGLLTFTPACISDGLLCRYTCSANSGNEDGSVAQGSNGHELVNSASSTSPTTPALRPALHSGDKGLGSIYVRSCFVESDGETAYGQRLTIELEFIRPVFGARVVVRLPSKYCRIQRSSTGGVGTVTQLMHQPRKCVWDIGEVTEAMCSVPSEEVPASAGASAVAGAMTSVDELMPGAIVPAAATSCARLELVFEQPPPGVAFGEEDEDARSSVDSDEDEDSRFGSTVSSVKSSSSKWRARSGSGVWRLPGSASAGSPPNSTTASTSRSRKREERARKAAEKAARIAESPNNGSELRVRGRGGDDVPSVEVVFSVNKLFSGTAVKKLQVLQETPNWVPRSRLDRLVLQRLVPNLEKMKLKKLARYTTWFVQPVVVSQLQ